RRDRIATEAEGVHADRQPRLLRRLVDRPVASLPERLDVTAEQQHLHEILVTRALADFRRRRRPILILDHDGALEAGILAGPLLDLPVVNSGGERGAEIVIADALSRAERIEHTERDVVRI